MSMTDNKEQTGNHAELIGGSEKTFQVFFDSMLNGAAYCRMVYVNDVPEDFVYIAVNCAFERQTGLKDVTGKPVSEVIPNFRQTQPELLEIYGRVSSTGQAEQFEVFVYGLLRWFRVSVYSPARGYFMAIFDDITEQKRQAQILEEGNRAKADLLDKFNQAQRFAHVGSWEWDLQSDAIWWSDQSYRIFGVAPETFTPNIHSIIQLIRSDDLLVLKDKIAHCRQSGEGFENDFRVVRPDGQTRDCLARGQITYDASNKPQRFTGVVMDITERSLIEKNLRESEAVYHAIGESLDYGIWICDSEGRNTYASQSLLDLLGITQKQCSEFGWTGLLHPADADATKEAWKKCATEGGFWECEHRYKGADGKWHPILARGVAIRNEHGEIVKWAGINLDIAKIKQTEERLREAIATRDDFFSVASHELRTPLTALLLQLELFKRLSVRTPIDIKRLQQIGESTVRSCQQLTRLMDSLLDVTRSRVGKLSIEKSQMDLRSAVLEVVNSMAEEARQKGSTVTVVADQAIVGYWDQGRVRQIVSNLLSNAIKYGEHNPIEISLSVNHDKQCATLCVRDNGVGIPEKMHSRIFQRFERASPSQRIGGLGLGLYIVRQIIEAHGGTIHVQSKPGKGSLFTVELPLGEKPT